MIVEPAAPRCTLVRPVVFAGPGVHTGVWGRVRVAPARLGSGWSIRRPGHPAAAVRPAIAAAEPGRSALDVPGGRLSTVEHLFGAAAGLGLTDLAFEVEGPEVPILDGSALRFVTGLQAAGRVEGEPAVGRRIEAVEVEAAGGVARAWPADTFSVEVSVSWPGGPQGEARFPGGSFLNDIAPARTFVFARDVDRLRAAGLGRGATPDNTLVIGDPDAVARMPDEPVRHKLLDALGDLALLGPVRGRFRIERGSHLLHLALVDAIDRQGS